ncbi:hypothetical protein GVAV_001670 [Gurleya vavrai]
MQEDQNVTPWTVKGEKKDGQSLKINYEKIIQKFGCQPLSEEILNRLSKLTKNNVNHLLKRGIVFAHRDFDKILDAIESNKKFYLYTGRGPSSQSMHLGHAIPFLFCKYLQDVFDVPLVIQISDDEKFLWKNMSLEDAIFYGKENIKDIIAFGFNPKKTFLFLNSEYSYKFYFNTLKIGKSISLKEASKIFGFDESFSVSQIEFPVKEIVPCFSSSFDFLEEKMICLVPAAIDQDPYFRLARDKAHIVGSPKPCTLYSSFLPDLNGLDSKMSASENNSSIFLTDSKETVKNKIIKYAFSGGRDTLKEQREKGANIEIDVSLHYLKFFMKDDEKLERIENEYKTGKMTTAEIKKECYTVINEFLEEYQEKRKNVSDEDYKKFTFFEK